MKTRLGKIIKCGSILSILGLLCFYFWVKGIYKGAFTDTEFETAITHFEGSTHLPENFYATLELVYPEIFKSNWFGHLVSEELLSAERSPCPCERLARRTPGINSKSLLKNHWFEPSLTLAFESRLTQKKCLNTVLAGYDFMNGNIGIEQAAKGYYGKELKTLALDEQLELIVMMENSSLYNKYRRPEVMAKKVEELKVKIGRKLK